MKNRNITILSIIVSLAGMGIFFFQPAFAETSNLVVEVWNDSLNQYELLGNQALFNEANFLPGEEVERLVRITNNSAESSSVSAEALYYPGFPNIGNIPSDDLSRALTFIIKEKDGSDLYGGTTGEKTLFDFYSAGETQFSTVSAASSKEFEFKIGFPLDRGDEWQEKTTFFDIIIGLTGSEGGGGGGENGGGGGGGGGGVLPPGLTITNESSLISEGCDTTISWTTTYFATSRVIYSPEGENHTLNLSDDSGTFPLYGYYSTSPEYDQDPDRVTYHTVTLLNLEPNTEYYFRCISHASPPTIGKECSFNTGECRGIIEVQGTSTEAGPSTITSGGTGPWQNQEPGTGEGEVLGEATSTEEEEKIDMSEFAASIGSALGNIGCLPWWLILVLSVFPLTEWIVVKRKKEKIPVDLKKEKVWLGWFLFHLALASYFYFTSRFCISVWILAALIMASLLIWHLLSKLKSKEG